MANRTLRDYSQKARDLLEAELPQEAIALCEEVLYYFPQHLETYRLLGEACLAVGDYEGAADMFRRVLSADPEEVVAYAGLAMIYEEDGRLEEALWHWERAFELAPDQEEIRAELGRLRARHQKGESSRVRLTRGGLGRLYTREGLRQRAMDEYSALLAEDPERVDIQVALAELLWREGQREAAAEVCQDILGKLPYCLKANLILGAIWREGAGEEGGETFLEVAQALDPENRLAQMLLGPDSPLPPRTVTIPPEEPMPPAEELEETAVARPERRPTKSLWHRTWRRLIGG
ncbi:MAG: tetratricopeptide repeat protein [Anaerolineae bacterium]